MKPRYRLYWREDGWVFWIKVKDSPYEEWHPVFYTEGNMVFAF